MSNLVKRSFWNTRSIQNQNQIFSAISFKMGRPALVKFSIVLILLEVLIIQSSEAKPSDSYGDYQIHFIPWGKPCKIPANGEPFLPEHGCDESKGILCQSYAQGQYCGCLIDSPLSYDRASGECRRMPYQHCSFVNMTEHPHALKNLPRHVKCHDDAECVKIVNPRDESSKTFIDICTCKPGYVISKDRFECHNVNFGNSLRLNSQTLLLTSLITFALYHCNWSNSF